MLIQRIAAVALCSASAIFGQIEKAPAFDAVSVKPLGPAAPGALVSYGLRYTPGRIAGNDQIPNLITRAYSLKLLQLVLPGIADIRVNRYQIDAVMPPATTTEEANSMLRTMLVERFGLQFHREMRDTPVYFLTVGAKPKLQSVDPDKLKDRVFDTPVGPRKGCAVSTTGAGEYRNHCGTISSLASVMGQRLDRPVIDQTGLRGTYDIDLLWDPSVPLDLISVVQQQFGLKLEKGKMPFEMFVVDHISLTPTVD
jgi:uncharacterized protein (TIGR03435 family)